MATRSDIRVFYNLSPRLVIVDAPSQEVTIQDLHDTLRDIEDEPANLIYPDLISTAGKEDLGGGVFVGLTATLQNAQLAFERRTVLLESGTVTTANPLPLQGKAILLTDSAATFITNGVERGDIVHNQTDNSYSEVLSVDSETQLTVTVPSNGSDNDYQFGDSYEVYEMFQCNITGGNLVAIDDVGSELDPVFPTFGTQVVRTSSSSATLSELEDLQFASFNGGVSFDPNSPYSGTSYPVGTPRQPVNNIGDAITIANNRGFMKIYLLDDATISESVDLSSFEIVGQSPGNTTLTLTGTPNLTNLEVSSVTLTGTTTNSGLTVTDSVVSGLTLVDGNLVRCGLAGTVTVTGSDHLSLIDCYSLVSGGSTPTIDLGGSGSEFLSRNYNGGITIANKTGTDAFSMDVNSGQVILANSVTNGTIILRGTGVWTNEDTYTGGATVQNQMVSVDAIVDGLNSQTYDGVQFSDIMADLLAMAKGRIVESPANTFTFYEQDNTTPRFVLVKTGNERQRT